jgi:hypothetical protein
MSDRSKGLVVTFERDFLEEDADRVADLIRMIRGVASVTASRASIEDEMNRERVRMELKRRLWEALEGEKR